MAKTSIPKRCIILRGFGQKKRRSSKRIWTIHVQNIGILVPRSTHLNPIFGDSKTWFENQTFIFIKYAKNFIDLWDSQQIMTDLSQKIDIITNEHVVGYFTLLSRLVKVNNEITKLYLIFCKDETLRRVRFWRTILRNLYKCIMKPYLMFWTISFFVSKKKILIIQSYDSFGLPLLKTSWIF